jgi:zinc transporter, ZIP family
VDLPWVAFDLVEGFESAGALPIVLGLLAGAATFYVGDWILDHRGGHHRKRSGGQQATGQPAQLCSGRGGFSGYGSLSQ